MDLHNRCALQNVLRGCSYVLGHVEILRDRAGFRTVALEAPVLALSDQR